MATKNLCGKTRPKTNPYEVWTLGDWTWHVLKKYQSPDNEAKNDYARWFCLVVTPYTGSLGDMGDVYVREITQSGAKLVATNY